MEFNPIFYIDFYKVGHVDQYPEGTKQIFVNFTPRSSRIENAKGVIFGGLQMFIKDILIDQFKRNFFDRSESDVVVEYKQVIKATLGVDNPRVSHIIALHRLGYLPLKIYSMPEGSFVPLGTPALVLTNTIDAFYWLPNYIETMMSNYIWPVCTSATTAKDYRVIFLKAAKRAGETDFGFIDWQGHDFSYRGMMGLDAACLSGIGHLMSFNGTDTLPAILAANKYYNAELSCGGSVPATEHSVMCAGGADCEQKTFERLITETYPSGIVSIVSDTWSLWDVLQKIVPNLKDKILARDGKLVIRPDSGDPVKILTGDDEADSQSSAYKGAAALLRKAMGTTGYYGQEMLNKVGLIYGDSITKQRADEILSRAYLQGFSPYNFVFGIGSYTYQYVTRDTYNFAFKATAVRINDSGIVAIFKDPVTDNAHKKSHRGIPVVYEKLQDNRRFLMTHETTNPDELDNCAFRKVFDGELLIDEDFDTIRKRVKARAEKEAAI